MTIGGAMGPVEDDNPLLWTAWRHYRWSMPIDWSLIIISIIVWRLVGIDDNVTWRRVNEQRRSRDN